MPGCYDVDSTVIVIFFVALFGGGFYVGRIVEHVNHLTQKRSKKKRDIEELERLYRL